MKESFGKNTAVVEGKDGKFYSKVYLLKYLKVFGVDLVSKLYR